MKHSPVENIGKQFNRLEVIAFSGFKPVKNTKYSIPYYLCNCICGKKSIVVCFYHLKNGHTQSCGCLQREKASETSKINTLPFGESALNTFFDKYIRSAKKRKIEFLLSKEEFKILIQKDCFYCGDKPQKVRRANYISRNYILANGIDRVNNYEGYTVKNCVACCTHCNIAKNSFTQVEFFQKVKQICQKHNLN